MAASTESANVAGDPCPDGPFETDVAKIGQTLPLPTPQVRSQLDANFAIPIEISRISEGCISFSKGGLMNEGISTWYAFDMERRLFVAVLASARDHPRGIPPAEKLGPDQLIRHTDAAGFQRAEFVTAIAATPEQARQFACLANALLLCGAEDGALPTPEGLIKKSFSLLLHGGAVDIGSGPKISGLVGELMGFIHGALQGSIMTG